MADIFGSRMRKGLTISIIFIAVFLCAGGLIALLAAQGTDTAAAAEPSGSDPADLGASRGLQGPQPAQPDAWTVRRSGSVLYGLSQSRGVLVSFDQGQTWAERNQGLSRRVVYPFSEDRVRRLTGIGVDPLRESRVAVTMASELFLSEDYGASWQQVPLGKPLRDSVFLTSVALSPASPDTLLLGTSFNGFFETANRGKSWKDPSLGAERLLNRGAGFYEEITGLSYDPLEPGAIWFACGFARGLYRSSPNRRGWTRVEFPGDSHGEVIRGLQMVAPAAEGSAWSLQVFTSSGRWALELPAGSWQMLEGGEQPPAQEDPFLQERLRKASDRFGIYVSSFKARGPDLAKHLKLLKDNGLNSMVVDCKDDFGTVTYDTALEAPRAAGAVQKRFSLEELVRTAHENGIYLIARVVVFKDKHLFNYQGNKYAVWNAQANQPWRYLVKVEEEENGAADPAAILGAPEAPRPQPRYFQREYWVDPYSSFVWEYNIAIAAELQARGVDEIQFDYIRFPSDGNLSTIRYRFKKEGMDLIDALESFLILARQSVHIPLSSDLYGFSTWHRMGNWIGQSIDMLADYVDVICPMFYPSHFPKDFLQAASYLERARRIYQEGTVRANTIVGGRSLIRPYIQSFLIGGELNMGVPEYSAYLSNQIQGALAAPSSGFTLWNASNRYYMVTSSLKPLLPQAPPAAEEEPALD
jgi:hypothetical protein